MPINKYHERPTIKDVAKIANVSTSTVSRVLNSKNWVKEETRDKVLNAMDSLNFKPSFMAQKTGAGLNKKGIIGIILGERSSINESHTVFEIIRGMAEELDEEYYSILFKHLNENTNQDISMLPMISQNLVDGLILLGGPFKKDVIQSIKTSRIPFVLVGKQEGVETHRILVDNFSGGYQSAKHLINKGCRNIGAIVGDLSNYAFIDKITGYKVACEEKNIFNENLICEVNGELQKAGFEAAKKLFSNPIKPDGLFITDGIMTIGAMKYLNEIQTNNSLNIPIVSYCKSTFIPFNNKVISYVDIGEVYIGHACINLLFDIINKKVKGPLDITISTRIIT